MFEESEIMFFVLALSIPLISSLIILIFLWKNNFSRYVGLLLVKPVFIYPFWIYINASDLTEYFKGNYELALAIPRVLPELIWTLIVVVLFRKLFRRNYLVWLLLIGDVVRWLSVGISILIPEPLVTPYFDIWFYIFVFFTTIYPSFYAFYGLGKALERNATHS